MSKYVQFQLDKFLDNVVIGGFSLNDQHSAKKNKLLL